MSDLNRVVQALKAANDKLAESVGKMKTIPPKPPVCSKCGEPRRPFAPNGLCEVCTKKACLSG